MCQIYCQVCQEQIGDDENVYEVRQGFVEQGDFTPEQEIAYYHTECYPLNNPTEDQ